MNKTGTGAVVITMSAARQKAVDRGYQDGLDGFPPSNPYRESGVLWADYQGGYDAGLDDGLDWQTDDRLGG